MNRGAAVYREHGEGEGSGDEIGWVKGERNIMTNLFFCKAS